MSEINIEIEENLALRILPQQDVLKMLRNGKVGDVTRDSVLMVMKRADQIGFNAAGESYKQNMALWVRHSSGIDYFETVKDNVDELALSLGVELPH